jgi:ATP-binding protein involved in chromosome partitioning
VTIPSEVARGVVARSVAALLARRSRGEGGSKRHVGAAQDGPPRILGYVENMSGYYCRDCHAVKPLFVSQESREMGIPRLGTVPFDPELARHCDLGTPLSTLIETPVGRALDDIAQRLLESLES